MMRCLPKDSKYMRWEGYHIFWYDKNMSSHSFNDQPACRMIEQKSDCKSYLAWAKDGLSHRGFDKPAYILNNGKREWWIEGNFIKQECL